uniref:Uncharacterized protein n=1 Tax=Ciona intestinalis TaxID=7719 RepID=H2XK30_CIOIN
SSTTKKNTKSSYKFAINHYSYDTTERSLAKRKLKRVNRNEEKSLLLAVRHRSELSKLRLLRTLASDK